MNTEDLALGIAGAVAQSTSMAVGKGVISQSLQTAISASTQAQAGATIVKGAVTLTKVISIINPITGAIVTGCVAGVVGIAAAIAKAEPMEFDDFDDMCAYANAHQL